MKLIHYLYNYLCILEKKCVTFFLPCCKNEYYKKLQLQSFFASCKSLSSISVLKNLQRCDVALHFPLLKWDSTSEKMEINDRCMKCHKIYLLLDTFIYIIIITFLRNNL